MRSFCIAALLLACTFSAKAQLFPINFFTGTTFFGSLGITVTPSGSVSSGGGPACFAATTDQYWIGPGGLGSYTYTLSRPIYKFSIHAWGINGGVAGGAEYMSMNINGVAYPITPVNVLAYTECMPGGGPCYLSTGFFMGPVGATSDYNGGDLIFTSTTGITSFQCITDGITSGIAYEVLIDTSYVNVCEGDTLHLYNPGDSTGATYAWSSTSGTFTSTLQNPFIYPVTLADSGTYQVIKTVGAVADTSNTIVKVNPKPVVTATNNSPLCAAGTSVLNLFATPAATGETFLWKGPPVSGFTSTLQNPTLATFVAADTGWYYVYTTSSYGCKDTGQTFVTVIPQPPTPVVTDQNYCQGASFVPFTITDTVGGDILYWYTAATGGTGSTTATTIPMSVPGLYYVWVSEKNGACESFRGKDSVRITTTPAPPSVSGRMDYCQFLGPIDSLTAIHTATGVLLWYNAISGGTASHTEPLPDVRIYGTYNYWVSQIDSNCESLRQLVTINVHQKPDTPTITPTPYCQFKPAGQLIATLHDPGVVRLWYGPGVTVGTTTPPTPGTAIAPDTVIYWVTETSTFGCVSDSAEDIQITKAKPPMPITGQTKYCQGTTAAPLNRLVDSMPNSNLNWYYNTLPVGNPPIPPTNVHPGVYTWYVSQTINGCEGDSTTVPVTIIYKPVFGINASSPNVCKGDSLFFSYYGPVLPPAPGYLWTLPAGATFIQRTTPFDSAVVVRFDTAGQNNYITLHASDDSGFCSTDSTIRINVIPLPFISASTNANVCLGDTVQLGLGSVTFNPHNFSWFIDNVPMGNSQAISTIAQNSNSSGPFEISWVDSGTHVIVVKATTEEGCNSNSAYDSVFVRAIPDATFRLTDTIGCIGDSVQFVASTANYNYSYVWAPAHDFNNVNSPAITGTMDGQQTMVTLTVTDPFGCSAATTQEVDPHTCCSIEFPNAFTPNGDLKNDFFRPVPGSGFHTLHKFVVVNRWGVEVFNGGNSNQQWDGNLNGVPQDMGVYFYYVKYDCGGSTFEQKGDVTLIR